MIKVELINTKGEEMFCETYQEEKDAEKNLKELRKRAEKEGLYLIKTKFADKNQEDVCCVARKDIG